MSVKFLDSSCNRLFEFDEFAIGMGIKVLNSCPYYAQANGQAEASKKRDYQAY